MMRMDVLVEKKDVSSLLTRLAPYFRELNDMCSKWWQSQESTAEACG